MASKKGKQKRPNEIKRVQAAMQRVEDAMDQTTETSNPESLAGIKLANEDLAEVDHGAEGYVEPWNRLMDESDRQWEMFKHYRDLGPIRTPQMTAEFFEVTVAAIHQKMHKRDWTNRARAWDQFSDRIYQAQRISEIKEMADTHAGVIVKAIEGLNAPIAALVKRIDQDPTFIDDLSQLQAKELLKLSNQSARILPNLMTAERLARGMATEIVEHTGEVDVNHVVTTDIAGEILDALATAGAFDGRTGLGGDQEIIDVEPVELHPVHPDE